MTDQEAVIKVSEKLGWKVPLVMGHRLLDNGHKTYHIADEDSHRLLALEICERDNTTLRFYEDGTASYAWSTEGGLYVIIQATKPDIYMAIIRKYTEDK